MITKTQDLGVLIDFSLWLMCNLITGCQKISLLNKITQGTKFSKKPASSRTLAVNASEGSKSINNQMLQEVTHITPRPKPLARSGHVPHLTTGSGIWRTTKMWWAALTNTRSTKHLCSTIGTCWAQGVLRRNLTGNVGRNMKVYPRRRKPLIDF